MQSAQHTADKLNGLLKGEISAVETYRQALEKVQDPSIVTELQCAHSCHSARVADITRKVQEFGGTPAEGSGAWGAFAKMMEGGAKMFGEKACIAVLEEGEDKGLSDYQKLLEDSDPAVQAAAQMLIAKQEGTHDKMSALKKRLAN
ncbi:MAG TPA: PA2169 family four-helix-bundle protein [Drouetiella sp.]